MFVGDVVVEDYVDQLAGGNENGREYNGGGSRALDRLRAIGSEWLNQKESVALKIGLQSRIENAGLETRCQKFVLADFILSAPTATLVGSCFRWLKL
jgi:hypothetical protein